MNIASIMAKVIPGTFVPDMGTSEKPTISPIPPVAGIAGISTDGAGPAAVGNASAVGAVSSVHGDTSFKDTVKQMLADVNDKLATSDQNTRDLASGKTNDLNKVVTSVEEANLSLQFAIAVRSKLLAAYSEVDRMSV